MALSPRAEKQREQAKKDFVGERHEIRGNKIEQEKAPGDEEQLPESQPGSVAEKGGDQRDTGKRHCMRCRLVLRFCLRG